ncbi:nucleoside-diphosphate-sugar epimerase [Streptomyces sp. 1114.5]|uniref:NAD-dependent epimerase/dehydratase family protein n=1 Tax=unclassified Streptomyces TaxID=2593676 RepID=UPI000BD6109A|nr:MULTISPECIES: NAD(P)-dependent oxidoreductase [unclassified Streptomyces]RKT11000.1 nucleoside-diphosphate-sugar epimerase [Streptomyces sp. 1114.5]SOB81664.1 Nucleoside-diphosphate-sugar epimerase [Streptomyces sp. 1331.2]
MRVVLLGGAGYIGSVASHHLVSLGHHVTVVDGLIYNRGDDPGLLLPNAATFVHGDLRDSDLLARACDSADVIVHLGGIVGEPACRLDEELAVELNYAAPMLAAEVAAGAGVGQYVFFSSCSVYGERGGTVDEDTEPNPLGIYARTKVLAERRLPEVLDGVARLTSLRLATVHGSSPRQRLDSVVNSMASRAVATGRIPLNGGAQRRPLVHVRDVAQVLAAVLEGDLIGAWNVGSDEENHTIADIAETVAAIVPGSKIQRGPERDETDARDYQVSFARLARHIPGACSTPLKDGVREIADLLASRKITDPNEPQYDNHRGLADAFTAGEVRTLRTPACQRYRSEYTAAWGQS